MAQDKEKKKSDHFASLVKHSRAEAHKSLVNTDRRTFPQQQQAAATATAAAIFLDRAQTRDPRSLLHGETTSWIRFYEEEGTKPQSETETPKRREVHQGQGQGHPKDPHFLVEAPSVLGSIRSLG